MKSTITWADFEKIDIRVGQIIEVNEFIGARKPAFQLKIDFGAEIGILKSSAQLTKLYDIKSLLAKRVIAVVNLEPKQIGSFMSQCLVLGVYDQEAVVLLQTERQTKNGAIVG